MNISDLQEKLTELSPNLQRVFWDTVENLLDDIRKDGWYELDFITDNFIVENRKITYPLVKDDSVRNMLREMVANIRKYTSHPCARCYARDTLNMEEISLEKGWHFDIETYEDKRMLAIQRDSK